MERISITIPAHNEQDRIGPTLQCYDNFFSKLEKQDTLDYELIVVLNGCTDATREIVKQYQQGNLKIRMIDLPQAGKGGAIIAGFKDALSRLNTFIGFVDADMATKPQAFYDLIANNHDKDGTIASRYSIGADIHPKRPFIKRWGSKLIYEPLVWLLFGLSYKDLQCGAKIFRRNVIAHIIDQLKVVGWAIDVELLYLCKKHGFTIQEISTVWRDKKGSKLTMSSGLLMLATLFKIRFRHRLFS